MVGNKELPSAPESEELLLGSVLVQPDCMDDIIGMVRPEMFMSPRNRDLFKQILHRFKEGRPIDLVAMYQLNPEWTDYLVRISGRVVTTVHLINHANEVINAYYQKSMIYLGAELQSMAFETGAPDLINYAEEKLFNMSIDSRLGIPEDLTSIYNRVAENIENVQKAGDEITGVPSGLYSLDKVTMGWQSGDLVIIAARPSVGKCLGVDTPVLMYDGSVKNVQDIVEGDKLMGDDSTPRNVLSTTTGKEMMYWVRQSNANDYRINKSHILTLKQAKREKIGGFNKGDVIDIPLSEFQNKSLKFRKKHFKGFKTGVCFPFRSIKINPYLLGLWLADGSSCKFVIHNPDKEIELYLKTYAKFMGLDINDVSGLVHKRCPAWSIKGRDSMLLKILRSYKLINNKHIPEDYLINDRSHRLRLLAGLLDGDGYLHHKNGVFEITQKIKKLAYDIKFLADSLGFKTKISKETKEIKSIGFSGEYYRLYISGNLTEIPLLIERKKPLPWTSKNNYQLSTLTIEKDKVDDYYGFTLDGNGRFLLGDCTVTHNTALALSMTSKMASMGRKVLFFSLEMSKIQLGMRLLSAESGVDNDDLKRGRGFDWMTLETILGDKHNNNIIIDDTASISVYTIRSTIRRFKRTHGVDVVFVDYLQLCKGDGSLMNNEARYYGSISRVLKSVAKEVGVPIILLSQLNRGVEARTQDPFPKLADLRNSGEIEQDADIVIFPTRFDKLPPAFHEDEELGDLRGRAVLDIAKHRNGKTDKVMVSVSKDVTRWTDPYK